MHEFIPSFIYVTLGALAIAIAAQITIPLPYIPITGQSLAVLLVACFLKSRLAVFSILLYLLLGILGIPVFAEASSGFSSLQGNSGGFLYGFVAGAFVVGKLSEQDWEKTLPLSIAAMGIGTAIILAIGVAHLSYHIGLENAITYGFLPFIAGALVKIVLGGIVMHYFSGRK